jgi:hypothetical protein
MENESSVVIVDDEDIAMCVKKIIACIRYIETSMRSTVSAGGGIICSRRESRQTGDFEVGAEWANNLGSGTPSKVSR